MFLVSVVCMMSMVCGSVFAAGTNVSSGFSWTVGSSYTNVNEWSNYNSNGCGVSVSYDSNADGFDYRRENYTRSVSEGSVTSGDIYGGYVSVSHNSSAGILSSTTGVRAGYSVASMVTEAWGTNEVNGDYVQISVNGADYNYEYGNFADNSGYEATTYSDSITGYVSTYSNSEFNY